MKLVIGDGERDQGGSVNGNASADALRFWVDTDDDGDWSDGTALLDSMTIDDVSSAGCVSVHCAKPCLRGVPRKHATRHPPIWGEELLPSRAQRSTLHELPVK